MNVFSYIRVSGQGQIDKDGPDRQRDAVKAFSKTHSLVDCGEFFEKGVSGTVEAIDRPAFVDLLEAIKARSKAGECISGIVVENMTRLARDLMVSEFLLAECRNRGIRVFTADSGTLNDMATDGGDPTRVMLRQILGAVAQWEKSMLVKKLRSARDRIRAKTGRCEGRPSFDTREGSADTIATIHRLRSELGFSYSAIADYLNVKQLPSANGQPWTLHTVFNVFKQRRKTRKKNHV